MSQNRVDYEQGASGLYRELLASDIRLLKVHAGDDATEVECDLEQVRLDAQLDYYALSYVWGDASRTRPILLNSRRFDVTENLYDALHHLRRHYVQQDSTPFIWIDAICINQKDLDERSRQVARMTDIYTLSRQTIIWLGTNEGTDQSIGELFSMASAEARVRSLIEGETLRNFASGSGEKFHNAEVLDNNNEDDNDEEHEIDAGQDLWDGKVIALTTVLGVRPWFSRIWTVQEACLGARDPILWAGRHCVLMQDLVDLLLDLVQLHPRYVISCFSILSLARIRQLVRHVDPLQAGSRTELGDSSTSVAQFFLDVVCSLNRHRATDPLDQLYGLLGLVGVARNQELPEQLRPDYRIKTELAYLRYATYFLNQTGDLRLLNFTKSELEGVPSWVPDFRYLRGGVSHLTSCTAPVSTDGRILSVRGFIIGTCDNQIDPCKRVDLICRENRELVASSCLARFRLFEEEILIRSAKIRQRSVEAALERWLSFLDEEITRSAYEDLIGYLECKGSASRAHWSTASELSLLSRVASGWLVLTDGTIVEAGMVDARTRAGDLICLFNGSPVPLAIRKAEHRYQFVCPADISDGPYRSGVKFDESFWAGKYLTNFELI